MHYLQVLEYSTAEQSRTKLKQLLNRPLEPGQLAAVVITRTSNEASVVQGRLCNALARQAAALGAGLRRLLDSDDITATADSTAADGTSCDSSSSSSSSSSSASSAQRDSSSSNSCSSSSTSIDAQQQLQSGLSSSSSNSTSGSSADSGAAGIDALPRAAYVKRVVKRIELSIELALVSKHEPQERPRLQAVLRRAGSQGAPVIGSVMYRQAILSACATCAGELL
eukprot:4957-Heterococcus_DN1.PRE.1